MCGVVCACVCGYERLCVMNNTMISTGTSKKECASETRQQEMVMKKKKIQTKRRAPPAKGGQCKLVEKGKESVRVCEKEGQRGGRERL